jgi:hypothetical protein
VQNRFTPSAIRTTSLCVLALGSLLAGCSRDPTQAAAPSLTHTSQATPAAPGPASAAGPGGTPHLYAVYCNGTVDHLDLQLQAKVASFQLSARSGTPPAIAALPAPGVRPDSCLARPAVPVGKEEQSAGVARIVATDQLTRNDADGRKPYRLLTFAVPAWALQATRDLGSFDVLNGTPPRVTLGKGRAPEVLSADSDDIAAILSEARQFAGGTSLNFMNAMAWSASAVLAEYADPSKPGRAVALIDRARRSVVRIEGVPGSDPEPALSLAPGGTFVLHSVRAMKATQNGAQLAATGELRLYGADGKLVCQMTDDSVAGDWHPVALTPQGLAVYTDKRGNYRFVSLGVVFGAEPVIDPNTDDLDGTRPGVIYAGG